MTSLTRPQSKLLSGYLADISKILLGATVINYFTSNPASQISPAIALTGFGTTLISLGISIKLST